MGDRHDRDLFLRRRLNGGMKPPRLILDWGLVPAQTAPEQTAAAPPAVGHNGGPLIEEPADLYVRHLWTAAHRAAWKTPPMDILRFRVARAEAAGVSYRDYMLELLDTGRHLQAGDKKTGDEPS